MDGFTLAERIRETPEVAAAHIMMITSARHRGAAERCRQLGIEAYIVKPVRKLELLTAILSVLGRSSTMDSTRISATSPGLPETTTGLQILLTEDNPVNQTVATRTLQKMGHSVVVANNGKEALSLIATRAFDVVLMDVQMPEMDGLTATRIIREQEKTSGHHLPIIAMTAHAMKGDQEQCLAAGMDDYISKPINSDDLRDVILRTVRRTHSANSRADVKPAPVKVDALGPNAWDPARALERLGGDEQLLKEVIEIFCREAPKLVASLNQAVTQQDAEAVSRFAHSLKGELGYLGLLETSQKARQLEEMGRNRGLKDAGPLFTLLEKEISEALAAMQARNANQGPTPPAARAANATS